MAIVSSFGAMQSLSTSGRSWWSPSEVGGSIQVGAADAATYGAIYRTQPNVRVCVDFIARNVAQLGLHVFRRVSDTDRVRLFDHPLATWLSKPNPATTRFRLFETLMQDFCIYNNAFWLKLRIPTERNRIGLLRLPPEQMAVEGGLLPSAFVWTREDGREKTFLPADVVHFSGYNPSNPLAGLSPMETLRQILAEVWASMQHRQDFWRNSARFEGIIERPKDAAKWAPEQRQQFREAVQTFRQGGARAGAMMVLEDGMTYKTTSANAKDSEYISGAKLAREICAAQYHIPLPFVGILEHATFSNMREQHKNLYQDCLGPPLVMVEEEIERQLLTECDDQEDIYTEFNIAEKLKGSFEEQATSLQTLVGRPVMTVNEGRARLNLPSHDNPENDQIAAQPGTGDSNQPPEDGAAAGPVAPHRAHLFLQDSAVRVVRQERAGVERLATQPAALREFFAGHAAVVAETMRIDLDAARAYCAQHQAALQSAGLAIYDAHWERLAAEELAELACEGRAGAVGSPVQVRNVIASSVYVPPAQLHVETPVTVHQAPRRTSVHVAETDRTSLAQRDAKGQLTGTTTTTTSRIEIVDDEDNA